MKLARFSILLAAFISVQCTVTLAATCDQLHRHLLSLEVSEGAPVGTVLYQFVNQTVTNADVGFFQVINNTVIVSQTLLLRSTDSETTSMTVRCTDSSASNTNVAINIQVINFFSAFPPVWSPAGTNGVVYRTVPEYSAVGSYVFSAAASDPNYKATNVICSSQFSSSFLGQYFSVTSTTSGLSCTNTITITQMFDYQTLQGGVIVFSAGLLQSNGTLVYNVSLTVSISVQDTVDLAPVFLNGPYSATLTNVEAQSISVGIAAIDGNTGINGPVGVTIASCSQSSCPFSNVVSGGAVIATDSLSWNTVYYLLLKATLVSAPWLTSYSWVQVNVPPAPTSATSSTTSTTTTTVTTTTGTTYPFTLVPCGALSSTVVVPTTVSPINFTVLQPSFPGPLTYTVMANSPVGFVVGNLANALLVGNTANNQSCSLAALRLRYGGSFQPQFSFTFIDGPPDFAVNATSGIVSVERPLNYTAQSAYVILASVLLTDVNATLTSAQYVSLLNVTLLEANVHSPVIVASSLNLSLPYAAVGSNVPASVIGQALAFDPDVNGSLTFASFDYSNTFAITPNGSLWLMNPGNVQAGTLYRFLVTVSDNWTPQARYGGVSASVYVQDAPASNQMQLATIGWFVLAAVGGCLFIVLLVFSIMAIRQKNPVTWAAKPQTVPMVPTVQQNQMHGLGMRNAAYRNPTTMSSPQQPNSPLTTSPGAASTSRLQNMASPIPSIYASGERGGIGRLNGHVPPPIGFSRASITFSDEMSDADSRYDQPDHTARTQALSAGSKSGPEYATLRSAHSTALY